MSDNVMQLGFHDAIKQAVMTKKPLVVVEGRDDLSIYTELINDLTKKFNVKPIEYFKLCSSGCEEIEKKITLINQIYPNANHQVYNYFKGIVDRDAKSFRNEINERAGILYLNSYSFENSFVTEESLFYVIKLLTSISQSEINKALVHKTLSIVNGDIQKFYYATLEALKNAVEPEYISLLGFSESYERVFHDTDFANALEAKYGELDLFAEEHGLEQMCILEMKTFCKGKWHLSFFLKSILRCIDQLYLSCGTDLVKCPLCQEGVSTQCLYKKKHDFQLGQLINVVKRTINNCDLGYVKNILFQLG
jgi:hypothetical protein